jgi:hypothetical protein
VPRGPVVTRELWQPPFAQVTLPLLEIVPPRGPVIVPECWHDAPEQLPEPATVLTPPRGPVMVPTCETSADAPAHVAAHKATIATDDRKRPYICKTP